MNHEATVAINDGTVGFQDQSELGPALNGGGSMKKVRGAEGVGLRSSPAVRAEVTKLFKGVRNRSHGVSELTHRKSACSRT